MSEVVHSCSSLIDYGEFVIGIRLAKILDMEIILQCILVLPPKNEFLV
jgi:hypothetical protein